MAGLSRAGAVPDPAEEDSRGPLTRSSLPKKAEASSQSMVAESSEAGRIRYSMPSPPEITGKPSVASILNAKSPVHLSSWSSTIRLRLSPACREPRRQDPAADVDPNDVGDHEPVESHRPAVVPIARPLPAWQSGMTAILEPAKAGESRKVLICSLVAASRASTMTLALLWRPTSSITAPAARPRFPPSRR